MNRKTITSGFVAILVAGLGIFALVKLHGGEAESGGDEAIPTVVTVQTGALKLATLHRFVQAYGVVQPAPATADLPAASAQIAAPTAGVVTKVHVIPGQAVTNGELLVELNSSTTTYALAESELARQKQLFEQQNSSQKNLQEAEAQLAMLQVIAPLAGTVVSVNVKPGQAVDASASVAEVMDLNRLAVTADIPSAESHDLKPGNPVEVLTDPPVATELLFVSPTVNTDSGSVTVRALLPAGGSLRPGESASLRIVTAVHSNCLAAPSASVVTDESGKSVIALVKGDEATRVSVQTGLRESGLVEVSAPDLKEGDTVVTVGAYGLPEKTKVSVQNYPGAESSTNSADAK